MKRPYGQYVLTLLMICSIPEFTLFSLAQTCTKTDTVSRQRLDGHLIYKFDGATLTQCLYECVMVTHCLSLNYDGGDKVCELNSANSSTASGGDFSTGVSGSIYSDISSWTLLPLGACITKPCEGKQVCIPAPYPVCEDRVCSASPPAVSGAVIDPTGVYYMGDTAIYTCPQPEMTILGDHTITCGRFAKWSPTPQFECKVPVVTPIRIPGLGEDYGGDGVSAGRLEIYLNDKWGKVCVNPWTWRATQVICRQLDSVNHIGGSAQNWGDLYGPVAGDAFGLMDINCTGSERDIGDCTYTVKENHCSGTEQLGVTCYTAATFNVSGSVRLINSANNQPLALSPRPWPGTKYRLEVKWGGVWGSLCHNAYWETAQTDVACRSLSTPLVGNAYCTNSCGGQTGIDTVFNGEVYCAGDEPHLLFCNSMRFLSEPGCNHAKTIALDCGGAPPPVS